MKNKNIILFIVLIVMIIVIIGTVVSNFLYKNSIILKNNKYCENDKDCECLYGCGCYNDKVEMKCISTKEGLECQEKGCKCENNQCIIKTLLSINNENDAIAYAKMDKDFLDASNKFNKDSDNVQYRAELRPNGNWYVSSWPKGTNDLWYYIEFKKQGKIIKKGYGVGA